MTLLLQRTIAVILAVLMWAAVPSETRGNDVLQSSASSLKPEVRRLIVWTDPCSANCRDFWSDVNGGLGRELEAQGWRIDRYEVRRRPLQAWAQNIMHVPCFVIPDEGRYWYGYHPAGFRDAFSLAACPALSDGSSAAGTPTSPTTQPVSQAELELWLNNQIADQRQQLEQQLSAQTSAAEARTQSLEQALALQQTVIQELRGGDPAVDARLDAIQATLEQLRGEATGERDQTPSASMPATLGNQPAVRSQGSGKTSFIGRCAKFVVGLRPWEWIGLASVGGLALTGGWSALILPAFRLVRGVVSRRWGRKQPTAATDAPGEATGHRPQATEPDYRELRSALRRVEELERENQRLKSQPAAKETIPLQGSKTHYQQVPTVDVEAEAIKEAMRRTADVYPDAAKYMELAEQSAAEIARGLRLQAKQRNTMQPVTGGMPWNDSI